MGDNISVAVEIITPSVAAALLKTSTGNFRRLDKTRVAKYASEMEIGRWDFNGETIKLNGSMVIDGQHRLAAIVRSKVPVKCIVVRNLDQSAGMTIDSGKGRTIADWMRFKGVKNAKSVTAIARLIMMYRYGRWGCQGVMSGLIKDSEVIDYIEGNEGHLQAAHHMAATNGMVQSSLLSALVVIACDGLNPLENALCVWFCEALKNGVNLSDREPVLALRNRFAGVAVARRDSPFMQKMMLTLAWNKTVRQEPTKLLKFTLTGPSATEPINTIEFAP